MYHLIASAKQLLRRLAEIKSQRQQDVEPEYELEELKVFTEQLVQAIVQVRLEGYTTIESIIVFLNQLQNFTSILDQNIPPLLDSGRQLDIEYLKLLQESFQTLISSLPSDGVTPDGIARLRDESTP